MCQRIAIADLGSNTLKLSVTEVDTNGEQRVVHAAAHTVRLSAGLGRTGMMEPARIERAIQVLQDYEQIGRELGAAAFRGVATAAVRMASNGDALIGRIVEDTAWNVRVIAGDEEARLTFLGLVDELPARGTCIIADVGGASTELIQIVDRTCVLSQSVQIGSGTLADRAFREDPPGIQAVTLAQRDAHAALVGAPAITGTSGVALYLSGGNGIFLSQVATWERVKLPFVAPFMGALTERISQIPAVEIAVYLGIAEERARMLPAGAAIAKALADLVEPASLVAVPSGIRGGLVREWFDAGRPADASSPPAPGGEHARPGR